jgi:OmcA/MtrC family decaheme c-type cytochrome
VPAGASVITYDLLSVDTVVDGSDATVVHPTITFKLKQDGTDVVFQTYAAGVTTEIMPNFMGSPSVYFAWAMPQDGIDAPADFNASASGYIRKIWTDTAAGTAGNLNLISGPDASGYYTITLGAVTIPKASATMLTGGVGYSYSLTSAPPLVQTNLSEFPITVVSGKSTGGLSVPAPNVWKVATGYTARRDIVDNAKCNACHGALGAAPTFHAGQRNDGPTCSFCHTPNRASNGWSAGSKYFIHALHAGRVRTTDFNWHLSATGTETKWEAEFPSPLNDCESCHKAGTYDFSLAANEASIGSQLLTTVAQDSVGTSGATAGIQVNYTSAAQTYFFAPGIDHTGGTNYGLGFAYYAATTTNPVGTINYTAGQTQVADPTTIVMSQITTACVSCHDSSSAVAHMRSNGGSFYQTRADAALSFGESCLTCHGPGKTYSIASIHNK